MRASTMAMLAVLLLAFGGARARAVGTITTTGATIDSGASPAKGAVTIDPAAPVGTVPTLPQIAGPGPAPSLTGSMPAELGYGDGSSGAFATSVSTGLAPGTHQFTLFTVTNGATVTISGATTILVQGSASIAGSVVSSTDGASIAIRCGGDFTLVSRSPASSVRTGQTSSPIQIVAGGRVLVGTDVSSLDAQVNAVFSDVLIQAHGSGAGTSGISVKSGRVLAPGGAVTARSTGPFEIGGISSLRPGRVDCMGPLTVQSFADRIAANSNGNFSVMSGSATLEAATQLLVGGELLVNGQSAPLSLTSVAGPMEFYTLVSTIDGDATLTCGGVVDFFGGTVRSTGSGHVSLAAAGPVGLGGTLSSGTGSVDLVSAGTVVVDGSLGTSGSANVRVASGDLRVRETASVQVGGTASLRASGTIDIGERNVEGKAPWETKSASRGSTVSLVGGVVEIAGGAGVTLDAETSRAVTGDFDLLAQGDVSVARTVSGFSRVSIRSIAGDIDVAGATVLGDDGEQDSTVAVETWKPAGVLDATNATIRSGAGSAASGFVKVLVHDGGPATVVESFILPKKLVFRSVTGTPATNRLIASGFYDTGPGAVAFTDAATITVGSHAFDIPAGGFGTNRAGTVFTYTEDGLKVVIVPNRSGSSRARCRVDASGAALDGAVTVDGDTTLSFQFGSGVAGRGRVTLASGRYTLGRNRGALVEPNLFPLRAKATLKGDGKDALAMVVGLATDGVTPDAAPDLHLEFGAGLVLDRAAGEFVRNGNRYVAPGVVLDYAKETITVNLRRVSLGSAFVDGAQPVTVKVRLGGETREVRVRMVRKGTRLGY